MASFSDQSDGKFHVLVFFTWDVSLKIWQDKGLLARELRLYEELDNKNVQFTFVTWGNEADLEIAKQYQQFKFIPIYTLIPQPKSKILRAIFSLLAPFKLKFLSKEIDIIKTNQMWGAWVAVIYKWLIKKPLLLRSGFELYDFNVKSGASFIRKTFIWLMSKFAYKNADHIFLATELDQQVAMKSFKVDRCNVTIRPNWIDTNLFKPIDKGTVLNRLLYVGRLTRQKNLKMLIEACEIEKVGLDIYGDGEMRLELEGLVRQLKADVVFKGAVSNDKLPMIYNNYKAYILCSHYEGNPKTLLEAMACGALCLGTNVDGIKNVIQYNQTGLICDNNVKSLKKSIAHIMTSKEDFTLIRKNAAKYIVDHYSLSQAIKNELKTYQNLKDN